MMQNHKPSSSPYSSYYPPMSVSGIQGQLLEVTVVGGSKLKNTEWISRQDPYVCLEYASTKYRTRTCTDGGKNPTFQEKFVFNLIEGLREFSVVVWNSNTLSLDDFIGSGKVQLQKVLSQGYDDTAWPLQDKRGRHAGEVRLIMHYSNANNKPAKTHAPSAPQYASAPGPAPAPAHHIPQYSTPPPVASYPPTSYPTTTTPHYPAYPPNSAAYPPTPYHQPAAYPPTYPPTPYPQNSTYPPPPQDPHYYPQGGAYPSAPYPPPPY